MTAKPETAETVKADTSTAEPRDERKDKLLAILMDGGTWRSARRELAVGNSTIAQWLRDDPQFREQYARACDIRADAIFEDMLEIADDGSNDWMERKNSEGEVIGWQENGEALRRSALRIETRKWLAGKMKPKVYGDKIAVGGADDLPPIQSEDVTDPATTARRVAFLLAKGLKDAQS